MAIRTVYDRPIQPYTPSLYMLSRPILGRYRSYPHDVRTPIPGAGFEPATLVWGEQELNLDGTAGQAAPYPYGEYQYGVPLRGMGADSADAPRESTPPPTIPPVQSSPAASADFFQRFTTVADYLWNAPRPDVRYVRRSGATGGGTAEVTYADRDPLDFDALVEYAKVSVVVAMVGVPAGLALGYLWGRASGKKAASAPTQNRGRRKRNR